MRIAGDLYFGAVSHVEEVILKHLAQNPTQRFLLLRMLGVNTCDFSGIHMLESVRKACLERGGDLYLMKVEPQVHEVMDSTGFCDVLGHDHILSEDEAITYLFHRVLDPAICIYECEVRAFKECQNLPKRDYPVEIPLHTVIPQGSVAEVSAQTLWHQLRDGNPPIVIDVREPREYSQGHIPQAELVPLPKLLSKAPTLPKDSPLVFVCRGGRRSTRAAYLLSQRGYDNIAVLQGGMLAWEASHLLEAVDS
jgi:SulP family sulfate permease